MLPKVRRLLNNKSVSSTNGLSNRYDSSITEDEHNIYTETLLYIVHVDEIDLPIDDQQQSNKVTRRISKRTTASFNERDVQTPKGSTSKQSPFSFSNPFRRLNNLLRAYDKSTPKLNVTPLCSSTAKKTSQNRNNHELFPPPPPEFLCDSPISRTLVIRANGPGLIDGFVNDNCHFDLNAPNAELQKLVIAIDGPSKADIQIEVINTGTYRIHYKCQSPGNYHISLTYDGTHINGSPYSLYLRTQPSQEQVVPPPTIPIHAAIEPVEFYVNTPCIVNVRPETPCGVFQAYIQTPQENMNLPIIVHKSAKSECYEIYFIPNTYGNYWLNVNLNHVPIVNNPCRLMVRPYSSVKSMVNGEEGLFRAHTGELSQFFVSKSPYDPTSRRGNFSVGISGPSTIFLDANETEHGYEFYYKPTRSGKYTITIKNGGKHIQGSPFICLVSDQTTNFNTLVPTEPELNTARSSMTDNASQVCVFGTGLYEAKKRRKATFKIDASLAGPGLLLVGLYSSLGPCERLVIKRIIPSSSGFIYKVSYRLRTRGEYLLNILYGSNMQHVPGSPYLVLVE